jgi:NADH-quinone oxidoreductase subunit F
MSKKEIIVGMASCGISAGAEGVYGTFSELIEQHGEASLSKTGCIGSCYREVLVEVKDGTSSWLYAEVTEKKAQEIYQSHILGNTPVDAYIMRDESENREAAFFDKQKRIVLQNTGVINPEDVDQYLAVDGYKGLERALKEMTPEEVVEEVRLSGLAGRGGAGFSTGMKWKFTAQEVNEKKYIVCNADEGDPGAFMDRSVLEGDPHAVLEGMAVAAYAIGAQYGYIYVRAEYPLAIKRLQLAIAQAEEKHYLGDNIMGTDFSLNMKLKIGAGAFVCGEETALIASIQGKRGMPRIKPPFPAKSGVWGYPTVINNVETLANIPWIMRNGHEAYAANGTEASKGTKVFALTGKIAKSGLVEVPMGMPLREIIFDIGGGIKGGRKFKAVQLGGPSGGCIPEEHIDTPVDYKSLTATGAIMGSGGMVIMDEDTCMVDVAKFFMNFIQNESCGKCTFCRMGTKRMYEILERITNGEGKDGDIEELERLAHEVKDGSLCGLGQTAPNPILTTLRYFREEYEEHIYEKKCRAKVCKPLLTYTIDPDACTGCTICAVKCPTDCITGSKKEVHSINQDACIQCGNCLKVCNFNAVHVE